MTDPLPIDGFGPLPVRRPATVPELTELVREAVASGHGLYPVGGGTDLGVGLPPIKPGVAADLRGLAGVIDYPARDMTITVQAGVTLAKLRETLAAEGQRLPVDVPGGGAATLGGAAAVNRSGPRRLGRGTLRDYVIGISFLTDAGVEVKAGGRVVKNVAGYDLMKLHVGALGTLGVVTQLTLKVTPKPEDQALVAFSVNAAAVGPTLDRLHASAARPVAVELLYGSALKAVASGPWAGLPDAGPWAIVVGFEEKAATVGWQVATLKDELKSAPVRDVIEVRGHACDPLWDALTELQRPAAGLVFKANVTPSRVGAFVAEAAAHPEVRGLTAHAGNGIVHGHCPADDLTAERASAILAALLAVAAEGNANVVVRACPPAWKKVLPVWGRAGGDRELMRAVKRTLDPNNVFNPGRLFGDL